MSKIVQLVEVIPAHVASLEEDYIRLEEMALLKKQEEVYNIWLAKKRESMYIYVDPDYRNETLRAKGWIK
jgi:peptidyl-prolyl cis-trans isomerase SurA